MNFNGSETIQAPIEQVWVFVTDPNQVGKCAPGLEGLEIVEPDKRFKAIISVGFGAVKARFAMNIEWLVLEPATHDAKLKASGKAPGSAVEMTAAMKLVEVDAKTTRLDWQADVDILGTIASIASRMAKSVTAQLTAQFFRCMKTKIEG